MCGSEINIGDVESLIAAVNAGDIEAVQRCVARGVDLNYRPRGGLRALTVAVQHGRCDIARLLLEAGADIDSAADYNFDSALKIAAGRADLPTTMLLLNAGADPDAPCNGCPALTAIANKGLVEMCWLLIDAGADVNLRSRVYGLPLIAAVFGESVEVIRILMSGGARVNDGDPRWGTPLIAAAALGNTQIIECLLTLGADPNFTNYVGLPLTAAAYRGNNLIVSFLLDRGACANGADELGETAIMAISNVSVSSIRTLEWIRARAPEGEASFLTTAQILIASGADVNWPKANGETPLNRALTSEDASMVDLLRRAGAL